MTIAKLVAVVVVLLLAAPLTAAAQKERSVVVGWLGSGSPSSALLNAFDGSLRTHGLVPKLEIRFAEGRLERLSELAADLVRLKPDLIVTADAVSTSAAKKATGTIPIVMASASDPVGLGLIQSLARPGGNVTGLSSPFGDEFTTKWVQLIREVRPAVKRIAVLWNPDIPAARRRHAQIRRAAQSLNLHLVSLEVRRTDDFEQAFDLYKHSDAAGLIVDNAPFITTHAAQILKFAATARVVTIWGVRSAVEAGGLLSYGTDLVEIYRRAAGYAIKILNGTQPADLPVEQPMTSLLVINLKTAKALGLNIPPSLLLRADQVLE